MENSPDRDQRWSRRRLLTGGLCTFGITAALPHSNVSGSDTDRIEQPINPGVKVFVERAFAMRDLALSKGDQGYGAIIVDRTTLRIIGQAPSRVVSKGDPTAHAELEAIRDAARRLGKRDLSNHIIYSSSKPCPMCEAAAYWANLQAYVYGSSGADGGPPKLCS